MLFELLSTISINTVANHFIDYSLLTTAFFSLFKLVNKIVNINKEAKQNKVSVFS